MNRKEGAIIMCILLATVIAWIVFGVFHARNVTIVTSEETKEIVPLTPTFDNDIIKSLSIREE